jgi:hypothetical protein
LTIDLRLLILCHSINLSINNGLKSFDWDKNVLRTWITTKNDCPILPPLSDIIKTYSKARAKQPTYAPITRSEFKRDRINFDLEGFQPENSGPLPLAASPSPLQNPPIINPSTSPTHNNLPQMIVPGGVALDHSNKEILDIQDTLDKEVERLKASTAEPLPIAAGKCQGQQTRPW